MTTTIEKHTGDLLENVKEGLIVHGCNAQGVMGAGIALAVRNRYPEAFEVYHNKYLEDGLLLGTITYYRARPSMNGREPLIVVNAVTQDGFGRDKRYVDYPAVRRCFKEVAALARVTDVSAVHFPLIGCGLAGGEWSVIEPIIEETLDGLQAHLWVLPASK